MVWVRARLCKLQKGCTRLTAASDKVYQLLAHGRWFSPASSTTKTGRHDITESVVKHQKSNQSLKYIYNTKYLNSTDIVYVHSNDIITSLMRDGVRSNVAIPFLMGVTNCCLTPIHAR